MGCSSSFLSLPWYLAAHPCVHTHALACAHAHKRAHTHAHSVVPAFTQRDRETDRDREEGGGVGWDASEARALA
eukprot:755123-Rhodomonas_salina.2